MNAGGAAIPVTPAHSARPPGPPARGLSGNLKEFSADRLGTLARSAREYGDLISARFGPKRILFASHPDLVEEVLVTRTASSSSTIASGRRSSRWAKDCSRARASSGARSASSRSRRSIASGSLRSAS